MRIILFCIGGLLIAANVFSQEKTYDLEISATGDNVNNMHGGLQQGSAFLGLLDVGFSFSPNNTILRNTEFAAHFIQTVGMPASEELIGDAQIASNIEGRSKLWFYELYIRQNIHDFFLLVGMHDMNSEFCVSNQAADLINSSFGIAPGISMNMPVSIFPVTTSAVAAGYVRSRISLLSGFYNMNHDFTEEKEFSTDNHIFHQGSLTISELQLRRLRGDRTVTEVKLGGFFKHCGSHYEVRPQECVSVHNYGFYLVADQSFFQNSETDESLNAFLQLNLNPTHLNYVSGYFGFGMNAKGYLTKKNSDVLGFGLARVQLNQLGEKYFGKGKFETVVELTYKQTLFDRLTFQPDLQYIINPGGNSGLSNAIVAILRLQVEIL